MSMIDGLISVPTLETITYSFVLVALLIYFVAGLVKGTLGIGFPTTAVSLLAQFTDARTAISLVILPMIVTNLRQVWRSRQVGWVLKGFWKLLVLMLIFIAVVSQLSSGVPVTWLSVLLGGIIVLYAASSLYKPVLSIPDKHDGTAQIATGISAGVMGGLAGVWAPPILIYLATRKLGKEQFVAVTGVLLLSGSCVLLVGYWNTGMANTSVLLVSSVLLLPSMFGMVLGEKFRHTLPAHRFERLLLWFFLFMGLNLIRRAWA